MTDVSAQASEGLAAFAAATMPALIERIPAMPARLLGRLAVPEEADSHSVGAHRFDRSAGGEPECLTALRALGPLPVERQLVVWGAPAAPEIAYKLTDQLGHRLRGEPEPARPPEHAYRWIRRSPLSQAATVTVVTGATVEQALRAFGADPDQPESVDDIQRDLSLRRAIDPWITVLDGGDAVLVVEDNGFRGTDAAVLRNASAGGRAASMFWNVNAVTRLSFAEAGQLLAAFEPWGRDEYPPEVAAALAGIDFAERGDRNEKGLVAVARFTGRGITAADLHRIRADGIGYRITG